MTLSLQLKELELKRIMENQLSTSMEGEKQPKSATEVVSDVLDKNTKNSKFLPNVSINIVRQRRRGLPILEDELEVEKKKNAELRSVVDSQQEKIDDLSSQVMASQKKQAELEAKLDLLLKTNQGN
jgi:septal ring factor EnvC (AmiA/AmiB activator)